MSPFYKGTHRVLELNKRKFNPKNFPNLILWLDANAGITLNSTTVSAWADQSGSGNDASQASASRQPTYSATGLNGRPTVAIGSTNFLALPNTFTTTARSIVMVYQITTPVPLNKAGLLVGLYDTSSTKRTEIALINAAGVPPYAFVNDYTFNLSGGSAGFNTVTLDANPHISAHTYNGGNDTLTASYTGTFDSISQSLASAGTFGGTQQSSIGVRASNSTTVGDTNTQFIGNISELLIYNRALSASEVSILNSYLRRKYGLS